MKFDANYWLSPIGNRPNLTELLEQYEDRGYLVFRNGDFNLNIFGWRRKNPEANKFNDYIGAFWKVNDHWEYVYYPATTVPGTPWLLNPMNKNGTAILVPGQYLKAYTIGEFRGYKTLVQAAPLRVYRDNNRDSTPDASHGIIETGYFGIHIHKAGVFSKLIGRNSAGCQVFQQAEHFNDFMKLCLKAQKLWGDFFTYTLLEV